MTSKLKNKIKKKRLWNKKKIFLLKWQLKGLKGLIIKENISYVNTIWYYHIYFLNYNKNPVYIKFKLRESYVKYMTPYRVNNDNIGILFELHK